jgi:hypothetical protein
VSSRPARISPAFLRTFGRRPSTAWRLIRIRTNSSVSRPEGTGRATGTAWRRAESLVVIASFGRRQTAMFSFGASPLVDRDQALGRGDILLDEFENDIRGASDTLDLTHDLARRRDVDMGSRLRVALQPGDCFTSD